MSLSEIRVNTTKTRTGVGTITYTETGPVITGIATASNFKTGSTNVHSTGVELSNINTGGSTATFGGAISGTTASFSGTVSIGGTLTYEDVTNIDAVGIITAKAGIHIDDSITHIGDTDTKIRFPGADQIQLDTGGTNYLKLHRYASVNFVEVGASASISLADNGANTRAILIGDGNASSTGKILMQAGAGSATFGGGITLYSHANSTNAGGVYIGKSQGSSGAIIFGNGGTGPTNEYLRITSAGLISIGDNTNLDSQLTVTQTQGDCIRLRSVVTNNAFKYGIIKQEPYNNNAVGLHIIAGKSDSSYSEVAIGGGVDSGYAATQIDFYTGATTTTATGTKRARINSTGQLLLGPGSLATTKATLAGSLDLGSGGISLCIGGDENNTGRTNSTNKLNRVASPHYTNAEEPVAMVSSYNVSNQNILSYGGGSGYTNAVTSHVFYTAANTTTTTGTERLKINSTGHISIGEANFSPSNDVHIKRANGGGDVALRITNNSTTNSGTTASLYFTTSSTQDFNTAYIKAYRSGGKLNFGYATETPTLTMKVSTGHVGINEEDPDNKLHLTTTNDTDYSTNTNNTQNLTNALLKLQNLSGTDNSGVNNYVGIQFSVANGANSTAQLNYVRTGNNAGAFQFKARNASSTYPNLMTITSAGKVEIGSGGNYGSSPGTLNVGSRATDPGGASLNIARGEAIGGGTGPLMSLVHGPDGGTQRTHNIYSYVGDLRIQADANENMEFHTGGACKAKLTSSGGFELFDGTANYIESADFRLTSTENPSQHQGDDLILTARYNTNPSLISAANTGTGGGTRITFTKNCYVLVCMSQDADGNTDTGYWSVTLRRDGSIIGYHLMRKSSEWDQFTFQQSTYVAANSYLHIRWHGTGGWTSADANSWSHYTIMVWENR